VSRAREGRTDLATLQNQNVVAAFGEAAR